MGEGGFEPGRILVVRLSALGDVLLATPAVRALKKHFPSAAIDWLVEAPYAPLVEANPYAKALVYEKRGRHARLSGFRALRRELAAKSYDLVVDLQGKPKTWLLRGLGRRAVAWHKRTPGQALASLVGRDPPLVRGHAVDLFLEALAPLGVEPDGRALDLRVTSGMRAELAPLDLSAPTVGIAAGTRWETKRWPAAHVGVVAKALLAQGLRVLLLGGPGDAKALAEVRAADGALAALPDTTALSVGGLAAAIASCRLVIAPDSGPAHVAAAVGTPVVALFGPTSPARWAPIAQASRVVRLPLECSPCSNHGSAKCPLGHHACMLKLEPATVLEAVHALLG